MRRNNCRDLVDIIVRQQGPPATDRLFVDSSRGIRAANSKAIFVEFPMDEGQMVQKTAFPVNLKEGADAAKFVGGS